ncbi:hypothetical protein PMAYCL1PPCAC_10005, partial [Pristionchus mayeri]
LQEAVMLIILLSVLQLGLTVFVTAVIAKRKYVEVFFKISHTKFRLQKTSRPEGAALFQSACFAIGLVLIPPIIAMCWRAGKAEERATKSEARAKEAETHAKQADIRARDADERAKEADTRAKEATALARRVLRTNASNQHGRVNYPRQVDNSALPNIDNIPIYSNPRSETDS